ncbi:phytoene desaturase [Telmatocola sphagniphila]|uniref:Phytoene desaturase n=1 Tax=Telmatocola sphagniphila TaxID=1123043 RepID=A0A8E6EYG5_9BACT|nr:phytoene desaturase family protein [Telmatocola sphagniphila]QVL32648.1 phytoene desaturase [Telmatocola sphagniphila]
MSRRKPSVVIIGAGPGGLASALMLAHAGIQVDVVERLPRVGGRCSAIEAEGYRFDVGPTFFLYPLVLERIFQLIGRNLREDIEMIRLDPQYHLIFGSGGDMRCTPKIEPMEAEIAKICEADAGSLKRYLSDNRTKLELFRPALESAFLNWKRLFKWDLMKLLPVLKPWKSLDSELKRYFSDPRVRLAFSFQSKYLGMSPFQCPSLFSILSFLEYEHGVHHPIGGCAAVSEMMETVARSMGVNFHLGEAVERILFEGKKAVGVKTREREIRGDALVINADFAQSMTKLVPNNLRTRWTDEKLEKKRYSCSTFMMYLGIEGLYDRVAHHTIYTSKTYEQNLRDIEFNHVLGEDPSIYVQNAGVTDSTLAPQGHSTLYVLAPVTHKHPNVDWSKELPAFREKVLKQLPKIGITDLEKRIRFEKIITPADWEQGYEVYKGATFNLAHNLKQMLHLRPRNRFEDLDSVYLVGGGTHPGSGLPVIYESARITSRILLNDFELDSTWLDEAKADPRAKLTIS